MEASIRNALGDIGNRIGLGNVQLAGLNKNEAAIKPIDAKIITNQAMRFTKTVTTATSTTTTTKTYQASSIKHQQQLKTATNEDLIEDVEKKTSGNTSSMVLDVVDEDIEIDSASDDEEDEEEIEESGDDDDDEEIMYSDDQIEDIEEDEEVDDDKIVNIDAADAEDPQLCSVFVNEIYSYLTMMERKYRISSSFLDKKSVTARMRSVLIDWLIQVHMKFQLLQETMYLTTYLIDAYLERTDVSKMQLQLVGVTAMFLASKYEEMYVPAIDDFVYMTDNTYTKSEIRKMEVNMCKTLEFGFGKPLPLHFLRRYSKAAQADPKQHTLAKYFMELSLHDAEFSSMDPSKLAACSLNLSLELLNGSKWNKTMEFYSGYKAADLADGMAKLSNLALKAMDVNYKYRAATNKYGTSKYLRISLIPELSGKYMRELASKVTSNQ